MHNSLNNPFFRLLLILLSLEAAAFYLLPYYSHPRAGEVARNPTDHRAWPEYLEGRQVAGEKLVVVIGNSQAVGKEIDDPDDTYSGLLRSELRQKGYPARLENWSTGGLRTVDIELLSMQAIERQADRVIFVLGYRNIDHPFQLDLDYPSSDINLIAGAPRFWRELGNTTFAASVEPHDLLKRFAALHSGIVRARTHIHDRAAPLFARNIHRYLFGYEILPREQLDPTPAAPRIERPSSATVERRVGELAIGGRDIEVRLDSFAKLARRLDDRLTANRIDYSYVWMPMARSSMNDASHANLKNFVRQASERAGSLGISAYDYTDLVSDADFYTFSHMNREGHRILKENLLPLVVDEFQ